MRNRRTLAQIGLLALVATTGACMEDETGGSYASPSHWVTQRLVLPAGTSLSVRLDSRLHSQIAGPGDSWTGQLAAPVFVAGRVLLPTGTWVHGNVIEARKPSRPEGAMLDLEICSVTLDGRDLKLDASADQVLAVAPQVPGAMAVPAVMDPRTAPLVLQPGTVMTFTIEESVAVRCER